MLQRAATHYVALTFSLQHVLIAPPINGRSRESSVMSEGVKAVAEIRKENLGRLVPRWGGPISLARRLQWSGSYLWQLLNARRPITEKTARYIEEQLDLPARWMDVPAGESPAEGSAAQDIDLELLTTAMLAVMSALAQYEGAALAPRRLSEVVALVYEQAQRTGSVDKTYLQRLLSLAGKTKE